MNYVITSEGDSREPVADLAAFFRAVREGASALFPEGGLLESDPPRFVLVSVGGGQDQHGFTVVVADPEKIGPAEWLGLAPQVGGAAIVLAPVGVRHLIDRLNDALSQVERGS